VKSATATGRRGLGVLNWFTGTGLTI
jgi:hypothetical protein